MNKGLFKVFGYVILILTVSILFFKLFQQPSIYHKSLGKISTNYVAIDARNFNIIQMDTPFLKADVDKYYRWDAWFYNSIKDNSYKEDNSGTEGRFAFFPLFPWVWKMSTLKITQIGFLNVLLFLFGFYLCINFVKRESLDPKFQMKQNWINFLLLLLPCGIVYFLPYTEALFVFTFGLVVYSLQKSSKVGYFIALTLFALTRPAFTFVLFSMMVVNGLIVLYAKDRIKSILNSFFLIAPLIIGTIIVIIVQYPHSHKLFKFVEVQSIWNHYFRLPTSVRDWSVESFGNSVSVIFFISIPSAMLIISEVFSKKSDIKVYSKENGSIFNNINLANEFLYLVSLLYIICITLFIAFWQGGSLNGLYRYIFCSPFFYIFIYHFLKFKLVHINKSFVSNFTIILFFLSYVFITGVEYSPEIEFRDIGYFLSSVILFVLMNNRILELSKKLSLIIVLILLVISTVWYSYMFNIFLSDGWLFT